MHDDRYVAPGLAQSTTPTSERSCLAPTLVAMSTALSPTENLFEEI
jgi:hypothetical protein